MDVELLAETPERPEPVPHDSGLPSIVRHANPLRRMKLSFAAMTAACMILAALSFHENLTFLNALYEALGLKPLSGLAFTNVSMAKKRIGNKYVLHLGGEIVNESDRILSVPALHISVLSRGDNALMSNLVTLPAAMLKPGESTGLPDEITGISSSSDRLILDIGTEWELLFR